MLRQHFFFSLRWSVFLLAIVSTACNSQQGEAGDTGTQAENEATIPPLDSVEAAADISETELQTFADALEGIQSVVQDAQTQMMKMVQKEGMELARFEEIQRSLQMPDSELSTPITAEEETTLDNIEQQIRAMEPEVEQQQRAAIQQAGLTPLRYQQLSKGIQQDQALSQKVQGIMQQRMMQRLQEEAAKQMPQQDQGNN